MSYIKTINVNGINLEYVQKDNEVYILNNKNKRYILGNESTLDFFRNYNTDSKKKYSCGKLFI